MNLSGNFGVSLSKIQDVLDRLNRLGLDPRVIEETVSRGGGPGGQKINKTSNCVRLSYPPMGLLARSQRERELGVNRFLALRSLVEQAEMRLSPRTSVRLTAAAKIRKRKARRRKRAADKYGAIVLGAES